MKLELLKRLFFKGFHLSRSKDNDFELNGRAWALIHANGSYICLLWEDDFIR